MRRVLTMMVPVTIALGLININLVVDTAFASLIDGDQSIRAIDAAFRLYILPQGIFSVAISTVLFPAISRLAANGDIRGLRRTVAAGLRQIFFLLLPASAFLIVLATPSVRLVFEGGAFDASSTRLTAGALVAFSLGLVFNGASLLVIRAFFAIKKPWLPTKVAFGGVILNAGLDALLYRPLGTKGIPLSTSITSFVTFLALVTLLAREIGGLHGRVVVQGFVRVVACAAAAGLAAWLVWSAVDGVLGRSIVGQFVSVSIALAASAAATLGSARLLDLPERKIVSRLGGSLR
jgi:putative peptidoglycan lipid II flippase